MGLRGMAELQRCKAKCKIRATLSQASKGKQPCQSIRLAKGGCWVARDESVPPFLPYGTRRKTFIEPFLFNSSSTDLFMKDI